MRLRLITFLVAACLVLLPRITDAEDRVTVRGNYYREPSTRVLQPMVEMTVDAPDERLTLGAGYLLDAITSASIAAGSAQVTGGDALFTELRHEAVGSIGSRLRNWIFGGRFRYSTETDYVARNIGISAARELLQRTITLSLSYSYDFNRASRIVGGGSLGRAPWCGGVVPITECRDGGVGRGSNLLQVHYLAAGYTHAVLKTLLTRLSVETAFSRGPQDNPYRPIPNGFPEAHPLVRNRVALTGGLNWMIARAKMVVEPSYRFYWDDWDIHAHSVDLRVHFRVLRDLRLRLRYRFYWQSEAEFWRDDMIYSGDPDEFRSGDPKMDDFQSHTPGIQLTYHLDGLARFNGLAWLAGAWIEATYNHVIYYYDRGGSLYCGATGDRMCGARLGSLAFSLPF